MRICPHCDKIFAATTEELRIYNFIKTKKEREKALKLEYNTCRTCIYSLNKTEMFKTLTGFIKNEMDEVHYNFLPKGRHVIANMVIITINNSFVNTKQRFRQFINKVITADTIKSKEKLKEAINEYWNLYEKACE